jgi:hypothetical protein
MEMGYLILTGTARLKANEIERPSFCGAAFLFTFYSPVFLAFATVLG